MRKKNAGQNALSYRGPGEWNKLPNELKQIQNINTFKHRLTLLILGPFRAPQYWGGG